MKIESEVRLQANIVLDQCLHQIPEAQVSVILQPIMGSKDKSDLLAWVTHHGRETVIFAEVSGSGEPRHARSAFYRLAQYSQGQPSGVSIFIAPYLSPETAAMCRASGVGYLDFAGNCHLVFDGIYLHVEGRPNPAAHSRPLRSLYQPKAERVLRVLLTQPSKSWRLQALADEAAVSVGQVYKVKELLLDKAWLDETMHGIFLSKPQALLADWTQQYHFGKHRAALFHTLTNLDAVERGLTAVCHSLDASCAFTGLAAASRYAPYASYQRTAAYVNRDVTIFQEPLALVSVQTGANVVLLTPYDDGVFYGVRQNQDISLVSPVQAYLDLQSAGGRGQEAAALLLQKEILPNWETRETVISRA